MNIIREPLKAGMKLNNKYTIVKKIGEGASCIVYEAISNDGDIVYRHRIKECFPFSTAFIRGEDGSIACDSDSDAAFETAKNRFKEAYKKTAKLKLNPSLANYIVEPQKIFEANNTVYSVFSVNEGKDYDQILEEGDIFVPDEERRIIISRFLQIANVISRFHDAGILCLDIKPHNILIESNTDSVKLFDFDSFATKEEVLNDSLEYISFSQGFAAPEQLTGKRDQITEKTDYYAIGAMLYYALFNETYDCIDEINKVDIEYNTMRLPDYQPEFVDALKEFFSKTLAVWPDDRFSSMKELIAQLKVLESTSLSLYDQDYFSYSYKEKQPGQKISKLREELQNMPTDVSDNALPRYLVLAEVLAEKDTGALPSSAYMNARFIEYVTSCCFDDTGDSKTIADTLCLLIWAWYYRFNQTRDVDAEEQCNTLFEQYCDNRYQSSCSNLLDPFIKYKLDSLSSASEVFDFMGKVFLIFSEDISSEFFESYIDKALERCQGDLQYYIPFLLFISMYISYEEHVSVDLGYGSKKYSESRNKDSFLKAEQEYLSSGEHDFTVESMIKFAADWNGFISNISPENYDEHRTAEIMSARYSQYVDAIDHHNETVSLLFNKNES